MTIRKAIKADCLSIASCLFLAMEEILYNFTGQKNSRVARDLMLYFVKTENNQYSYRNCLVAESEGKVIGAINCYDGAELEKLRQPVMDYIRANFNPTFAPENETREGEIYIDSLGVLPGWQGKGIATKLLSHLIEEQVEKKGRTLGLIVEAGNENARNLYMKLGFTCVGIRSFAGKQFEHLQITMKSRN
jgi:ribosomal protein S18 acetylase RimI-like enzyme